MHCCRPVGTGAFVSRLLGGRAVVCWGRVAAHIYETHMAETYGRLAGGRVCLCAGGHFRQQVGWSTQKGCGGETREPQQTACGP